MAELKRTDAPRMDTPVAAVFDSYPAGIRLKLLGVRSLIFQTALDNESIGTLTETLKWGEPAYLTEATKSGSTLRIAWKKSLPDQYGLYFNCRTTLVDTFRTLFPELVYEGNRAIVLSADEEPPWDSLGICIAATLTYHRREKM